MDGAIWAGYETAFRDLQMLQSVQTLSEKSNLLISATENWAIFESWAHSDPETCTILLISSHGIESYTQIVRIPSRYKV